MEASAALTAISRGATRAGATFRPRFTSTTRDGLPSQDPREQTRCPTPPTVAASRARALFSGRPWGALHFKLSDFVVQLVDKHRRSLTCVFDGRPASCPLLYPVRPSR